MQKNKFSSYFIIVSFLTFITILFSIVQKSYFNLIKPQKVVENNALLKEINPNLDLSAISIIESKNKNTEESFDFTIIKSGNNLINIPTVEPTIQPTVVPTTIPTVEPTL